LLWSSVVTGKGEKSPKRGVNWTGMEGIAATRASHPGSAVVSKRVILHCIVLAWHAFFVVAFIICELLVTQRDPVVVYWPSGFLEAWGTKAKKPQFSRNVLFLLALPQGQKNSMFLDNCVFLALVPQASKTPLGQ
jgi:hypothetical protein